MSNERRVGLMAASAIVALLATGPESLAQGGLPNLYRPVRGLADGGGPFVPGGEWASRPAGPPAPHGYQCLLLTSSVISRAVATYRRRGANVIVGVAREYHAQFLDGQNRKSWFENSLN
jgi:hypothetical protein